MCIRVGSGMEIRRVEEWDGMAAFSCVSDYSKRLTCRRQPASQPTLLYRVRHRLQRKRHSVEHGPVHMPKVKQAGGLGGFPAFAGLWSRGQWMASHRSSSGEEASQIEGREGTHFAAETAVTAARGRSGMSALRMSCLVPV
jgi:hypothetical protein